MKTLNSQTHVADIVTECPSTSRLMESLGIDYCCQGRQSLATACGERGLNVDEVLAQITKSLEQPAEKNLKSMTLSQLADHVEALHHAYLRETLPLLARQVDRVAVVHGPGRPELLEVKKVFHEFATEMLQHMVKEEQILFPMIRKLEKEGSTSNPLAHIMQVMESEHDDAGEQLAKIRELTNGYVIPEGACTTYRAMLGGLKEVEEDTHLHVHAENHVLFPGALELASK